MATWNRDVSYDADSGYLVVTMSGNGAEPPPVPEKGDRTDTADDITTYSEDRPATIKYHCGDGVDFLTGLAAKEGASAPPFEVTRGGALLTVTDDGATGTDYSYYVQGVVAAEDKQTQDPQIHNLGG